MWQRFTERARNVIFYAQEEAQGFGETYVSTEHILLGLVRATDSVSIQVLERLKVSPERIRIEVEKLLPTREVRQSQEMSLTPRAKRVIDMAYEEARNLSNNYIGTEHLLLGLINERDGIAGRVLAKLGVELKTTRVAVAKIQAETGGNRSGDQSFSGKLETRHAFSTLKGPVSKDWERFTPTVKECLHAACEAAVAQASTVWPGHLLICIVQPGNVAGRAVSALDIEWETIKQDIEHNLSEASEKGRPGSVGPETFSVVIEAVALANELNHEHIGSEHLLLALLEQDEDGFITRGIGKLPLVEALNSVCKFS